MVSVPVNPNALSNHYNPRRTRIFVSNLNKSITVADVRNKFSKYGQLIDVRKPKNSVACVDFKTKFMATSSMTAIGRNCIIKGTKVELSRKMPTVGVASVQTAQPVKQNPGQLARVPTGAGGNSLMISGRVGRQVGLGKRVGFGPGRVGAGPGRVGAGPGRVGAGPGRVGAGPGRVGLGPGRVGAGPGRVGLGPGRVGLGPGRVGLGPGRVGLGPGRVGLGPGRVGGTPRPNLRGAAAALFTRGFPGGFKSAFEQASLGGFMNGNIDDFSRNQNLFGNSLASNVVPSVQSTIQTLMKENLKLRSTAPSPKQELDRLLIQNMRRLQQENEAYTKKLTSFERDNDALRETLQMANESLIKTQQQNALEAMNKELVSRLSLAEMLKQSAVAMPQQPLMQMQQLRRRPVISRPGMKPMQRQNNVKSTIRNRLELPIAKRLGGVQKRLGGSTVKARVQLQKRVPVKNFRNDFSKFNNADSWK